MQDRVSILVMLLRYWRTVLPVSHRELRRWQQHAVTIPDPVLRRQARETLARERGLCEGAALLGTLAPRRQRARVVRLLVAVEVLCDYLDTLTEQPAADPLANGRRLHRALSAALGAAPPSDGWYVEHLRDDDGGYLDALVASCRTAFAALPAAAVVAPVATAAASRSGEGQSRNHAAMLDGGRTAAFVAWCRARVPDEDGLHWWEVAAGACSSLTLHALLAAAADPATTAADARRIEAAYFPWISGLSSLYDSIADRAGDMRSGNHSYVTHYPTPAVAARRIATITRHAATAARELPRGRQHVAILAAMACFFLTGPHATNPAAARGVLAQLGVGTGVLEFSLRLRRLLGGAVPDPGRGIGELRSRQPLWRRMAWRAAVHRVRACPRSSQLHSTRRTR